MKLHLILPFLFIFATSYAQQQKDTLKQNSVPGKKEDYSDDWADLHHYATKNKELAVPKRRDKRVVFLGSSIIERWADLMPEYFAAHQNYINRGISGQISPQLLIRFRQDVINLHPRAVIILAGSNDISGSLGHVTNDVILDNVKSMYELAKRNHIKVILCKYVPVFDYPWRKGIEPADKIISLNKQFELYAKQKHLVLLDFFTPMVDERNGQKAELTIDGVHPNAAGYHVLAEVTDKAIAKALP